MAESTAAVQDTRGIKFTATGNPKPHKVSHQKNDSGSYDTPPNGLSSSTGLNSSAAVTILVPNGELESRVLEAAR